MTTTTESDSNKSDPITPLVLSEEELLNAIRMQVEYYFSKENLQQDAYLTSHMDANMSVPLAVIMKVIFNWCYCIVCMDTSKIMAAMDIVNRRSFTIFPTIFN